MRILLIFKSSLLFLLILSAPLFPKSRPCYQVLSDLINGTLELSQIDPFLKQPVFSLKPTKLASTVSAYYQNIDRLDYASVEEIFDPSAVYFRDQIIYNGLAEISHFFRVIRKIRGTHKITKTFVDGNIFIVEGSFTGETVYKKKYLQLNLWIFGSLIQ